MKIKNIFLLILLVLFSSNICLAMEETRCADLNIDAVAEQRASELINFLRSDAGRHWIQFLANPMDDNMVCGGDEFVEWQKRLILGEQRYHKLFFLKALIQKNPNFFIEAEICQLIPLKLKMDLMGDMLTSEPDKFKKMLETENDIYLYIYPALRAMFKGEPVKCFSDFDEDESKKMAASSFFNLLADLVWSEVIRSKVINLFSYDEINHIRKKSIAACQSPMAVKVDESWNLFETIGRSRGEHSEVLALAALGGVTGRGSVEQCLVQ